MCEGNRKRITYDSVHNPRYNDKRNVGWYQNMEYMKYWPGARFMYVFKGGDLNSAAHLLAESMKEPFQMFPFASVAVQQSVRDEFIERVRCRFRQLKPHVVLHPNFERSADILRNGDKKYIVADCKDAPPFASPILVPNVTHLHFGSGASGVVTVHSFRTFREAANMFLNESPPFEVVHVFDEKVTSVYSIAKRIRCVEFFVNCSDVCLLPILPHFAMKKPRTVIFNNYHFETLKLGDHWRIIVFPISNNISHPCCCAQFGNCTCYLTGGDCCE
ncbi:uncharacterized protein LOC115624182 [Scaptodrosophila lebanonensis]|uniref:Uncharacterized protein LOC115624182 n=1 Tax=Drosophila lebanonensis TaxID=7225 RepID=A0A6J2THP3_DROLE|nr:uncharacterized protein LOC115624182 [Scaptodrosophila lebanonensis]